MWLQRQRGGKGADLESKGYQMQTCIHRMDKQQVYHLAREAIFNILR